MSTLIDYIFAASLALNFLSIGLLIPTRPMRIGKASTKEDEQ